MKIKVLVVDDHPITRIGVHTILKQNENIFVVDDAKDGVEAIRMVDQHNPDVVIMDITMPNLSGIDATKEILKNHPGVKVVALSIHSGEKFVNEMIDAGAVGYLLKDDAADELLIAIEKVCKEEMYISSAVTRAALKGSGNQSGEYEVLMTKLLRPAVADQYIIRKRIIDELELGFAKPVSIVSAGPGYGKSIVVSQWLEESKYPHTWITLDEDHNDLRIFLIYLVKAIEIVIPSSFKQTKKAITDLDLPPFKQLVYTLFNELCELEEELILVLDDYHKISDERIHQLLNHWLQLPPPNIHLCIITRRDPQINTKSLKLNGRITEIRMNKLSFTSLEIRQLFKEISGVELNDHSIELIRQRTEGWVIALRLASMMVKSSEDVDKILNFLEGSSKAISDFFISETLSSFPENIKNQLLCSSILNRFCVNLLDSMGFEEEGQTAAHFLEVLKKSNMFLVELDFQGTWYRYHNLFQTWLNNQLRIHHSQDFIRNLHRKASIWFEENHLLEEAMRHAVEIKDYERATNIIKIYRTNFLNHNNLKELELLLGQLPHKIVNGDIDLMLASSYLSMYHSDITELESAVNVMEKLVVGIGDTSTQLGEFNFFKGYINFVVYNNMVVCVECFNKAVKLLPIGGREPYAVSEQYATLASQILGNLKATNKVLEKRIQASNVDDPILHNKLLIGYLMSNTAEADLNSVEKHLMHSIEVTKKSKMVDDVGMSDLLAAMFYLRKGKWIEAINYLDKVLANMYNINSRSVIDSISGLIVAYLLTGQQQRSLEMLSLLERYTEERCDHYQQFYWSCKLRYHILCKDTNAIRDLLLAPATPVLANFICWFDIPAITYCRALIFEGSKEHLDLAGVKLEELARITAEQHNYVHLLEVYTLQAMLLDIQGKSEASAQLLSKSLSLSKPSEITAYFVELGKPIIKILNNLPKEELETPYVQTIINSIEKSNVFENEQFPVKSIKETTFYQKEKLNTISPRELDVLKQVALGLRNQEISSIMCVSEDTVKKHLYNMFQKFNVKNRMSLVYKAKDDGIID